MTLLRYLRRQDVSLEIEIVNFKYLNIFILNLRVSFLCMQSLRLRSNVFGLDSLRLTSNKKDSSLVKTSYEFQVQISASIADHKEAE